MEDETCIRMREIRRATKNKRERTEEQRVSKSLEFENVFRRRDEEMGGGGGGVGNWRKKPFPLPWKFSRLMNFNVEVDRGWC